MVLLIAKNPVTKPALSSQLLVAVEEDILAVAGIIKAVYKPGQANTACLANGRVNCLDGVWIAYCGKYNTWSGNFLTCLDKLCICNGVAKFRDVATRYHSNLGLIDDCLYSLY